MRKTGLAVVAALAVITPGVAGAVELAAAINSAQAGDPTVASALAGRDAGIEGIEIARSRLLPQVSMQVTEQQLRQTSVNSLGPFDFNGRSRSGALSVRQSLFRPRDWAGVELGRQQAEYGEAKLAAAQAELWTKTVHAWLDVLSSTRLLASFEPVVSAAAQAAQQEQRRFERGDGTRDQAAEFAATLQSLRAQQAEARADDAAKRRNFELLTRLAPSGFEGYALPDPAALPDLGAPSAGFGADLVSLNPEVRAAIANERINQLKLEQLSSDHLPTVDLLASAAQAQNDSTNTLGTRYRNTQLGVQVVIPIYAGGGIRASERQQAALLSAATSDRLATEQKLAMQVQADIESLAGLKQRIAAAAEALKAASEQRRAAEIGMKAGIRTWADASAAAQLTQRRTVDQVTLSTSYAKIQARLMSLLPTSDPRWEQWVKQMWDAVRSK